MLPDLGTQNTLPSFPVVTEGGYLDSLPARGTRTWYCLAARLILENAKASAPDGTTQVSAPRPSSARKNLRAPKNSSGSHAPIEAPDFASLAAPPIFTPYPYPDNASSATARNTIAPGTRRPLTSIPASTRAGVATTATTGAGETHCRDFYRVA
ncbi:hypothetical protein K438DRAFT_1840859 [Mycena galopus ATCC 62051]|nr:hypothetical protein K438DRAFT_1840859 [Mycena galopus ATCC 62051]